MYLQTENIGMKITQANNGYMGKQQTHTQTATAVALQMI